MHPEIGGRCPPQSKTSVLEHGDGCPYCAHYFELGMEILTCPCCKRQGCDVCVPAGACCAEDGGETPKQPARMTPTGG